MNLRQAWTRETSATPNEWTPENPARGQCAITALVIQDVLGGALLRTTVSGESHYLNQLPNGEVLDFTFDQFPKGSTYDQTPVVRDREYVLSFPATAVRYELLRCELHL